MDEIRGEDFRKAWPNALARALREAGDLATQLDEQRCQVKALAETTPRMIEAAERRLQASTNGYLDMLATAQQKLLEQQQTLMHSVTQERAKLEQQRDLLDQRREEVVQQEQALKVARHQFNNMPFWSRLLGRA